MKNVKIVQLEERMAELENKVAEVKNTNDFGMLGFTILNAPTEIKVLKSELESLVSKYGDNLEQNISESTYHPAIMGNEVAQYTVFNGTAREFIELHERKLSLLELILDIAKERKGLLESGQKKVELENNDFLDSRMTEQEKKDEKLAKNFRDNGWYQVNGISNVEFMYDVFVTSMEKNGYWIDIRRMPTEKELNMREVNVDNIRGLEEQDAEDIMESIFS